MNFLFVSAQPAPSRTLDVYSSLAFRLRVCLCNCWCAVSLPTSSAAQIKARNGYSCGSYVERKDRSLLAVQFRNLPTVNEKIRKKTSSVCVPANIRTRHLPEHTSEAAANSVETFLYFCVTSPFTVHFPFLWPYTHNHTNFFYARLLYLDCDRSKL
jgi:hypothetical protein